MPLDKPLDELQASDVQELQNYGTPEGECLEFKRDLPDLRDREAKHEFLCDVSSFANTSGGHLIFGVTEGGGVPTAINGLPAVDRDGLKLAIHNLLRDAVRPSLTHIQIKDIEFEDGRWCLVMRIASSWLRPHAVPLRGGLAFYMRNSAGKYPLDVAGLRSAYVLSTATRERIRDFRAQRLSAVLAGETPIPVGRGPKAVIHFLPLSAFETDNEVQLHSLVRPHREWAEGPRWMGGLYRYNLDGLVFHSASYRNPPKDAVEDYLQFFASGIAEVVDACSLRSNSWFNDTRQYDRRFVRDLRTVVSVQEELGVGGPIFILTTFLGMRDWSVNCGHHNPEVLIDRDILTLPDVRVDDPSASIYDTARPILDAFWRAGGWPRSLSYNEQGEWQGSQA